MATCMYYACIVMKNSSIIINQKCPTFVRCKSSSIIHSLHHKRILYAPCMWPIYIRTHCIHSRTTFFKFIEILVDFLAKMLGNYFGEIFKKFFFSNGCVYMKRDIKSHIFSIMLALPCDGYFFQFFDYFYLLTWLTEFKVENIQKRIYVAGNN